jgi:hypothetical protein
VDFVIIDTGRDIRAPIIRAASAKICLQINYRKEWFSFKNCVLLNPAHPQMVIEIEDTTTSKKRRNKCRRSRKSKTTSLTQEVQEVQEPQEPQEPQETQEVKKVRLVWRKKEVQISRSPSMGPNDAPKE